MKMLKWIALAVVLGAFAPSGLEERAEAAARRQYYGGWSYYPSRSYYYRSYYYKPYPRYDGYAYHYCICYPSTPRYYYYYNPSTEVYWGRFDTEAEGDNKYSLLEKKDRKKELKDIPEKAFPKPGPMPAIPESDDGTSIEAPPSDLPKDKDKK